MSGKIQLQEVKIVFFSHFQNWFSIYSDSASVPAYVSHAKAAHLKHRGCQIYNYPI